MEVEFISNNASVVSAVSKSMNVTLDPTVHQDVQRATENAVKAAFFGNIDPSDKVVSIRSSKAHKSNTRKQRTLLDFDAENADCSPPRTRARGAPTRRWSPREQQRLSKLKAKGWTDEKIGEALQRTTSAVKQQ